MLQLDAHKTTIIVTKYRTQLNESELSPTTINHRLTAIKSLIAFEHKMGVCTYINITIQLYQDTSGVTNEEFIIDNRYHYIDLDTVRLMLYWRRLMGM